MPQDFFRCRDPLLGGTPIVPVPMVLMCPSGGEADGHILNIARQPDPQPKVAIHEDHRGIEKPDPFQRAPANECGWLGNTVVGLLDRITQIPPAYHIGVSRPSTARVDGRAVAV